MTNSDSNYFEDRDVAAAADCKKILTAASQSCGSKLSGSNLSSYISFGDTVIALENLSMDQNVFYTNKSNHYYAKYGSLLAHATLDRMLQQRGK